jgi:hypothetical protein
MISTLTLIAVRQSVEKSNYLNRCIKPISIDVAMNNRKMYNTTIDADLIRQIKILAAQLEKRQNDLIEEAIEDLLKKYAVKIEA